MMKTAMRNIRQPKAVKISIFIFLSLALQFSGIFGMFEFLQYPGHKYPDLFEY